MSLFKRQNKLNSEYLGFVIFDRKSSCKILIGQCECNVRIMLLRDEKIRARSKLRAVLSSELGPFKFLSDLKFLV